MTELREFQTDVTTPDGTVPCFAVHPAGDAEGPFPPVILYMDVVGVREELRDFARRIAGEGYFCLLPDMFYRLGPQHFDLSKGREELERMFAAGRTLEMPMVMRDTEAWLDYLDASPLVAGPAGAIGYCMSGRFVVAAAGTFPERFGAIASLYGVGIVTDADDSPHLLADRIRAELYLGFAEHDPFVPGNVIPELRAALEANGVAHAIETHPGTEHGFCFPQRPAYAESAAERVWATVFDLYARRLKTGA